MKMTSLPFRFFDLPPELQIKVYQKFYEDSAIVVRDDKAVSIPSQSQRQLVCNPGQFRLHQHQLVFESGRPALEQVCRRISKEARDIRRTIQRHHLSFRIPGLCIEEALATLATTPRHTLLRSRLRSIEYEVHLASSNAPCDVWSILTDQCPNLNRVRFWKTLVTGCKRVQNAEDFKVYTCKFHKSFFKSFTIFGSQIAARLTFIGREDILVETVMVSVGNRSSGESFIYVSQQLGFQDCLV